MNRHIDGLTYCIEVEQERASTRGIKHGMSKLTPEIIVTIRNSKDSVRSLARQYNVSSSTIWAARKKHTYI